MSDYLRDFNIVAFWAGVTAFTAYALRFPLDYAVTAAVLLAVALAVQARRRRA